VAAGTGRGLCGSYSPQNLSALQHRPTGRLTAHRAVPARWLTIRGCLCSMAYSPRGLQHNACKFHRLPSLYHFLFLYGKPKRTSLFCNMPVRVEAPGARMRGRTPARFSRFIALRVAGAGHCGGRVAKPPAPYAFSSGALSYSLPLCDRAYTMRTRTSFIAFGARARGTALTRSVGRGWSYLRSCMARTTSRNISSISSILLFQRRWFAVYLCGFALVCKGAGGGGGGGGGGHFPLLAVCYFYPLPRPPSTIAGLWRGCCLAYCFFLANMRSCTAGVCLANILHVHLLCAGRACGGILLGSQD